MSKLLAGAMGAVVVLVCGGLSLIPGKAEAQVTWRVENYGVDSPTCGTVAAPCRSITQAITNANAGDIVSVGPGRYGDLDGDGILGSLPGEEVATACRLPGFCLLSVNKRLTIRSTQGAGATVLDAGGANLPDGGVLIRADGVVFGQVDAGFTITGLTNGFAGIAVGFIFLGGPSNVRVGGNRVAENVDLFVGIDLFETTGSKVVGNLVSGKGTSNGVSVLRSTGVSVTSNVAIELGQFGFGFQNSGVVATGNAAIGNRFDGFELSLGEIAPGVPAPPTTLNKNTAAGNLGPGIRIFGTPSTNPVTLSQNNIYGNHTTTSENCGLVNATHAAINATNNFWGAASGPGPDPADDICNFGASTTTFVPFATVPFPIPGGLAGK